MQRFERAGVKIPYSTISDWVAAVSRLIKSLYETLVEQIELHPVIYKPMRLLVLC